MSSRRDQVEAQRYMLTRVTGAMVRAEPETAELPTRRDRVGALLAVVFSVLMLGGVALWALLPGSGSTKWQQSRMLIVDSSTGARYVLVDGVLRPVNDAASATLLAGGRLTPITVEPARLAKKQLGSPVGTADRPQVLPVRVNEGVWRACSSATSKLVLDIDIPAAAAGLGGGEAFLVSAGGRTHVLWGSQRWSMPEPWIAEALGLGLLTTVPVTQEWLDLLPVAGDLAPPRIAGSGQPGPRVAGQTTIIGQLFEADMGGGVSRYAATAEGLQALTETEFRLLRARPGAQPETRLSPAAVSASLHRTGQPLTSMPAAVPAARDLIAGVTPCVELTGRPGSPPRIGFVPGDLLQGSAIRVRLGGGALLRSSDKALDDFQAVLLFVDERGVAYPVAASDVDRLGYGPGQSVVMPISLVKLLPLGPSLVRP